MENIINTILSLISPDYFLLLILILLMVFVLAINGRIEICFDYKKGKITIKVNKKQK